MNTEKTIQELNNLITKNYDAEKGYISAASQVHGKGLKAFFEHKANQRYQFGHEIKEHIHDLGGDVKKGGSLTGDLHRVWMDIKGTFSADAEEEMLREVERGERSFVTDYNNFLERNGDLPENIRRTISRQRDFVERTLNKVEKLEMVH